MPGTPGLPPPPRAARRWKEKLGRWGAEYLGMLVVTVAVAAVFGCLSDEFLSWDTMRSIASSIPPLLTVAVGMTLVLIIAGIDLAVGSVMAFAAGVLAVCLLQWELPLPAALLLAVLSGVLCGAASGAISTWWAIPSFIVSLGLLEVVRGGAYLLTDSKIVYIGSPIEWIGVPLPQLGLSPAFLIAVAAVAAGQILLTRTVFGRYLVAIGTNETAVRLSGINPRPIKIVVFALSGGLAAVAGIFHAARLASADPNAGAGLELNAIAAVVIGGTSLMGGRGSVLSTFFGVLIIAILEAGLAQVAPSDPAKRLVTGMVIVVAVIADVYRQRLAWAKWTRWFVRGQQR